MRRGTRAGLGGGDRRRSGAVEGSALEARGLTAGYGGIPVIRDVNIVVRPGEIVALFGANGAGKSTTMLALAGELDAMAGEVFLAGSRVSSPLHKRARGGLAFVPEERSIFRKLSCRDNLRVGRATPQSALELFPDLTSRLDIRGGLLSGGEQQMLTLGRALSMKPSVLLVDELSLGLAPLIVRRLFDAIRAAAAEGAGVLLVEQHVRQAMEMADRAYIMRRGQIELSGSTAELRGRIDEIERSYLSTGASAQG